MSELSYYYLQTMGIQPWILRTQQDKASTLLSLLERKAANCQRCQLCETRTHVAFARGNPQAKLMIIGEAPGFHEDQQGIPFVGKAGQLLNGMLHSIGLSEQEVYIANVIKCRPPNNRDPKTEEIEACTPYLVEQIDLIKPKLILAVGRFAGQFIINHRMPLNKMRNQSHLYQNIPVIVSYHPAYLLRNPKDKKLAYQDLIQVKALLTQAP